MMDNNLLVQLLIKEKYPDYLIGQTVAKLNVLHPTVNAAFSEWLLNGTIPDLTIEEYSYTILVNDFGMKPVGAFLTLDWLVKEPEDARMALKKGIK